MPLLQHVQLGRIDNSVSSSVLAFHRRSRTVLLLRSEYFVCKVASPDLFEWTDVGQWLCPVGLPPMLSCAALESYDAFAVLFGSASETHLFLFNLPISRNFYLAMRPTALHFVVGQREGGEAMADHSSEEC